MAYPGGPPSCRGGLPARRASRRGLVLSGVSLCARLVGVVARLSGGVAPPSCSMPSCSSVGSMPSVGITMDGRDTVFVWPCGCAADAALAAAPAAALLRSLLTCRSADASGSRQLAGLDSLPDWPRLAEVVAIASRAAFDERRDHRRPDSQRDIRVDAERRCDWLWVC